MAEYIDRNFALDVVRRTSGDYAAAFAEIAHATAADVAPIVRCKDCVYSGVHGESILFCENFEMDMMPDDFCSVGARMDGTELDD